MTTGDKPRTRIDLLLEVGLHFQRYELEFEMSDAIEAALCLGRLQMADYIKEAQKLLQGKGSIRIGRMFGVFVVTVDLFKGTVEDAGRLADEIVMQAAGHGAIGSGTVEGVNGVEAWARWE